MNDKNGESDKIRRPWFAVVYHGRHGGVCRIRTMCITCRAGREQSTAFAVEI